MWRKGALPAGVTAAVLLVGGCASGGHGAKAEVNAVVQDEAARQAAATAAKHGEDSNAALKAGADAADHSKGEARPPT